MSRQTRGSAAKSATRDDAGASNGPRIVNLADLPWRRWWRNEHVAVEFKDPARHLGSMLSGLRIERLAPGKQSSPLQRHLLQEEMFLIFSGTGVLRHSDREIPVKPGDFIFYRAGEPAAETRRSHADGTAG
jgi:uncharacterized cupin superfamily protein